VGLGNSSADTGLTDVATRLSVLFFFSFIFIFSSPWCEVISGGKIATPSAAYV